MAIVWMAMWSTRGSSSSSSFMDATGMAVHTAMPQRWNIPTFGPPILGYMKLQKQKRTDLQLHMLVQVGNGSFILFGSMNTNPVYVYRDMIST
jgi:hypothetical protein